MKIPKYVINNAKWRITGGLGWNDIDQQKERVIRLEQQILKDQKKLEEEKEQLANDLSAETEIIEWLKSIGEYEEPKPVIDGAIEQTGS